MDRDASRSDRARADPRRHRWRGRRARAAARIRDQADGSPCPDRRAARV
jgi:hypothetical protein